MGVLLAPRAGLSRASIDFARWIAGSGWHKMTDLDARADTALAIPLSEQANIVIA
jgi:hypothetical protein